VLLFHFSQEETMRKKLFRLSLGVLAVAVATAAAPRPAMARVIDGCPSDQFIGGCDCSLFAGLDCSMCTYSCGGCGDVNLINVNECGT
jgi:hypothetical protein